MRFCHKCTHAIVGSAVNTMHMLDLLLALMQGLHAQLGFGFLLIVTNAQRNQKI